MNPVGVAKTLLGPVMVLLSIVFLVYSSYQSQDTMLLEQMASVSQWGLVWGTLLFLLSNVVSAASWHRMTDPSGRHIKSLREAAAIWMISNTGKYLPGNVIHFLSRYRFATDRGVGSIETTTALVVEVLTVSLAAMLLTLLSFLLTPNALHEPVVQAAEHEQLMKLIKLIVSLLLIALTVSALAFRYVPNLWQRVLYAGVRMKRHLTQSPVSWLQALALCMSSFLLAAVAAYLNLQLLPGSEDSPGFTVLLSAYALAFLAGYVIPGAPGGIGIREAALVLLLAPATGETNALLLALTLRLCSLIADFTGAAIGAVLVSTTHASNRLRTRK